MNDKKYKLMAVDIDGTLLRSDHTISKDTLDAINNIVKKQKYFVIATGRPFSTTKPISDMIPFNIPLITANGALIRMSKTEEVIFRKVLQPTAIIKICELAKQFSATLAIWTEEELYINKIDDYTCRYQKLTKPAIIVKELSEVYHLDVLKIIWFDEAEKLMEIQKQIKDCFNGDVNYFTSQATFLEFVDGEISKAEGIRILGNYLNIPLKEIIAVGDGYNDLAMIKKAGLGIVMENAVEELKQQADYVTLTNDEDGVAYAINKFML